MSAFMVSKEHIDALVAVAVYGPPQKEGRTHPCTWWAPYFKGEQIDGSRPNALGQALYGRELKVYPRPIPRLHSQPGLNPRPYRALLGEALCVPCNNRGTGRCSSP